jgi:hypothetical protein
MLEYVKKILMKVSFDAKLFEKELRKSIKMIVNEELTELRRWCYNTFGDKHEEILDRCFVMNT